MRLDYASRDSWGARYAAGTGPRPLPTSEAWLHHTATATLPVTATVEQERAEMRKVEAIGQTRFGAGFSYNLAGFPSGRWYVGCGVRRLGSHTAGRNTRALGVVLVGNYDSSPLPAPLRASLPELLRDAHEQGWIDAPKFDGGHRDLKATACPGQHAYRELAAINCDALGIEIDLPVLRIPPVTVQEDDMAAPAVIARGTGNRQYLTDLLTTKRWIRSLPTVEALKADGIRELPGAEYDGVLAPLADGPDIP